MKPAKFPASNVEFAKDQPEYQMLPAHVSSAAQGVVTTCWELNDIEVAAIVKHRRIWLQQMTFGEPLQPQLPSAIKPSLIP